MIHGKEIRPEDILEAAWRRKWLIVIPFVVIGTLTVVVSSVLKDRYQSEALLQIVPQRVPETYVRPTVTSRLDERVYAISQQILSRTQLERIIQEFDLYADERRRGVIMEDIVEQMRSRDVLVSPRATRADGGAFTVGFEADNPRTAMQVAEKLAGLFIKENLEDRSNFADQTDQFLQSQLEDARRQLKEHEAKLEEFRRANPGRMPNELEVNQQALNNAQNQLQTLQESINRDRDRQLMLQRMIADAQNIPSMPGLSSLPGSGPMTTAEQLELERTKLQNMRARLLPTHPDYRNQEKVIRDLEKKAATEALQQPVSRGPVVDPRDALRAGRISEWQGESDLIDRRIASRQNMEKQLLGTMSTYRSRIESVPAVETRMTELMRDYKTLQTTYETLLTKSQEAKVAANLERRQIGEQFRIIDSPRMPQRPTSPNRLRLILLGAMFGLALGVGLAALLEYRDSSLRTEDDVVATLSLPVLALVPTMTTAAERRKIRRQKLLIACSGTIAVVLSVALLAWKFRSLTDWIR